jgi:ubiquinol-cytochrome c reductase cytochrome b subunit
MSETPATSDASKRSTPHPDPAARDHANHNATDKGIEETDKTRPALAANATSDPNHVRILNDISWHSAWLTVIVGLFGLICLTGLFLMTAYSPSATTAWASVWYIQTQLDMGWLIRGLHRFATDALMILLPLYAAFALLTKLYAKRYSLWWIGLLVLGLVMAGALSGYVLPWDQRGYWGMRVRVNILALTPWVGDSLRGLLIGGSDLGHLTLTRLYALHVMIIPAMLALLGVWWIRTHCRLSSSPSADFERIAVSSLPHWSESWRALRDAALLAAVVALIGGAVWLNHRHGIILTLEAPADASAADYPARPEWFNLFLFQWLKWFQSPSSEVVGAVVVPGAMVLLLLIAPFIQRVFPARLAHRLAVGLCSVLAVVVVGLTLASLLADRAPSSDSVTVILNKQRAGEALSSREENTLRRETFNRQRDRARRVARRTMALAEQHGVPPEGPLALLADDPLTRGPELFAAHCASCHRIEGHNGLGVIPLEPATSSDLGGYGTREWIRGFLNDPMNEQYFGLMKKPDGSPAHTRMAEWLAEQRSYLETEEAQNEFERNLDAVAAFLALEAVSPGAEPENDLIVEGRQYFMNVCNECHSYRGARFGTFSAPEMYGYGSVDWIAGMIEDPSDDLRYRSRGREPAQMPAFKDRLTERERRMIAQWLHAGAHEAERDY